MILHLHKTFQELKVLDPDRQILNKVEARTYYYVHQYHRRAPFHLARVAEKARHYLPLVRDQPFQEEASILDG